MTISIQGSTAAALATLEALSNQQAASAGSATQTPTDAAGTDPSSAIIDLSSLASGGLGGAASSLASSGSIADAATASGTLIGGLLAQMRDAAASAANPSLDSQTRSALNAGFQSGLAQIQTAIGAAGVDGVNLLNGSANGQTGSLAAFNLSLGGPLISVPANASLSDPTSAAGLVDDLGSAIDNVSQAVGTLSTQSEALQFDQAGLTQGAVGASVDPTLDADGARLAALQVQQQLSGSSGSIGNQTPAAILALFR